MRKLVTYIGCLALVLAGCGPVVGPVQAQAEQDTLTWERPTKKENGQNLAASEIDGYEIQYKVNNGGWTSLVNAGAQATQYTHTIAHQNVVWSSTYTYRVKVIATYDCPPLEPCESDWSNEAQKERGPKPEAQPFPVGNLRVV